MLTTRQDNRLQGDTKTLKVSTREIGMKRKSFNEGTNNDSNELLRPVTKAVSPNNFKSESVEAKGEVVLQ